MAEPFIEQLETALKKHDWYYSYSDDSRVYRRGVDEQNEIRRLLRAVPRDQAKAFWQKFAPPEFTFPLVGA
jgi:hypothetical protein